MEEAGQHKQRRGGGAQDPDESGQVEQVVVQIVDALVQGHRGQLGLEQLAARQRREQFRARQQRQSDSGHTRAPSQFGRGERDRKQGARRKENWLEGSHSRQGPVQNALRQGASGRRRG